MIIAQVSISPIGVGVNLSPYIKKIVKILNDESINCYTNAMATVIEAETIDHLFTAIKKAHEAMINEPDVKRVITQLKIDHRTDKDARAQEKIDAVTSK